jgi:hypothetical protein
MRIIFIISFALSVLKVFGQVGQWTWMKGNNIANQPAIYGTQGIPSATNKPAAAYEPIEWTDMQGNFWLMGGQNFSGLHSDLWKYNRFTNEWTWMKGNGVYNQLGNYGTKGVSAASNLPGGRGVCAASWTDSIGNLWLFGGWTAYDAFGSNGIINDLWRYNIANNEWTWMHGSNTVNATAVYGTQGVAAPANTPSDNYETCATWTDNMGNLWLYGGYHAGVATSTISGYLHDVWKYNIATNMWTWMKGTGFTNQLPVYGTKGVSSPSNNPGGRWIYSKWVDDNYNLWIFGGENGPNSYFNDLWKYDISTNMWTWINGASVNNHPGSYGTKCIPSASNLPPARSENRACWKDKCGRFWMLGGTTQTYANNVNNDLWCYDPDTDQWTWASGSNVPNSSGSYGAQGVSNLTNSPPSRLGCVGWISSDTLWLFGGRNAPGIYNDLWNYVLDPSCPSCNITGINENIKDRVSLFPNPSTGEFTITRAKLIKTIFIYNFHGELILEKKANTREVKMDLSSYPKGMYFVTLKHTDESMYTDKLILTKDN